MKAQSSSNMVAGQCSCTYDWSQARSGGPRWSPIRSDDFLTGLSTGIDGRWLTFVSSVGFPEHPRCQRLAFSFLTSLRRSCPPDRGTSKIFLDQITWAVGGNWSRDTFEGTSCVRHVGREDDLESSYSHLSLRRSWLSACCCCLKTTWNSINEQARASVLYMLEIRSTLPEARAGFGIQLSKSPRVRYAPCDMSRFSAIQSRPLCGGLKVI